MFDPQPKKIYWFYSLPESVEDIVPQFPFIEFHEGVPTTDQFNEILGDKDIRPLVILDDLMNEIKH